MRRLAAVLLLIFALSFPVLGGHTRPGFGWCDCSGDSMVTCTNVEAYWQEDVEQIETPNKEVSELDLLVDVLLMLVRF